MRILKWPLAAALPLSWVALSSADDWPQWRGPRRDNISVETGWSSTPAPRAVWRAEIGRGYSTPLVADGRVFVCGFFGAEEESKEGVDRVACLDAGSGEVLWSQEYAALIYDFEHGGGVIGTAGVHEGVLYVPTRSGEVRAFDAANGSVLWEIDLVERHEVDPSRYGFASSPLFVGDDLVLNAGRTVRLERATGETVWISEDFEARYSTAARIQLGEIECLTIFGGAGAVVLDASSGEEVCRQVFRESGRNVEGATPIVMGTRVLVSSAYEHGAALIEFAGDEPEILWRSRRMRTKMAGSTLCEGFLYGFDESMLKCVDLEGNERWRKRGLGQGALSVADGRLLLTTSDGELIVAAANEAEYREESRTPLIEGGVFWAAPVLADGRVYVRGSLGELVCLDHRGTAVAAAAAEAERPATPGTLVDPAELAQAHREAMGLADRTLPGVRQTGVLNNDALGLAGVATEWATGPGGLWHMSFALPAGMPGKIQRTFDGELGWETGPRGNKVLEGADLTELRRTRGFGTLFDPIGGGREARSRGVEDFRGARCHRVDVVVDDELTRSVYFDVTTGLLVGRTAPDETTVILADWRDVDGVLLPFSRTHFDVELGQEWRYRFDETTLETLPHETFAIPDEVLEALEDGEEEPR